MRIILMITQIFWLLEWFPYFKSKVRTLACNSFHSESMFGENISSNPLLFNDHLREKSHQLSFICTRYPIWAAEELNAFLAILDEEGKLCYTFSQFQNFWVLITSLITCKRAGLKMHHKKTLFPFCFSLLKGL